MGIWAVVYLACIILYTNKAIFAYNKIQKSFNPKWQSSRFLVRLPLPASQHHAPDLASFERLVVPISLRVQYPW